MVTRPLAILSATLLLVAGCGWPTSAQEAKPGVLPAGSGGQGGKTGTFANEEMKVGSGKRAYRLVVPEKIDPKKPAPLVFAFHGLGDSKDLMAFYSRLDRLAARYGFLLVYPNGRNKMWSLVVEWAKEDLDFFDALYSQVSKQYNVDLDRVYLTGMSNGAYFSHVVASQRSDKVAAIAPHSGGLGLLALGQPKLKRKYAVLVIHGEKDSIVPVKEGRETHAAYKKWGHDVEYLEVPDHNHFWAHKADVNEKIWKFFHDHPRR